MIQIAVRRTGEHAGLYTDETPQSGIDESTMSEVKQKYPQGDTVPQSASVDLLH
jgi:hypothetical protein